jgi:DNA-nicking Smr family endonuclease
MKKILDQKGVFKLDLHGKSHANARNNTIRFIEEHWDDDSELEIITGHSTIMKGIVLNVLDEYSLPYQISYMNTGKIIAWT